MQIEDSIKSSGIIRFREIPPEWTPEQYARYWCHMSERERDRTTVHEARNILTTAGRTQLLTYFGSGGGSSVPFSAFFAVGTAAMLVIYPNDSGVQGEIFRVAPASSVISGTQMDILSQLGSLQAVGTLTNAGLYGTVAATSSTGTGTLYTHALINSFVKASGAAYSCDYLVGLQ